jgi:hypothetical protein
MSRPQKRTPGGHRASADLNTNTAKCTGDILPIAGGRRIPVGLWRTPEFTGLRSEARLCWLCLSTSPDTNIIGLVARRPDVIGAQCGLTRRAAEDAIEALLIAGFVSADTSTIWVRGHLERQLGGHPKSSPAWWKATHAALEAWPESDLVAAVREYYGLPPRGALARLRKPAAPKLKPPKAGGVGEGVGEGPREGVGEGTGDTPVGVLLIPSIGDGVAAAAASTPDAAEFPLTGARHVR